MPFSSWLHWRSWLGFILIKNAYLHDTKTIRCWIARYTIDSYHYCRNIHNQIDGGDFSFSSTPRWITKYTSCIFKCKWGQTGVLHSRPPCNNTILGVPIHIQFAHQISKFCRSVSRSIIYLNFQGQAPRLPWASLAGLSFRLIPKSRNFFVSWASLQYFLGSWKLFEEDFQPSPATFCLLPW